MVMVEKTSSLGLRLGTETMAQRWWPLKKKQGWTFEKLTDASGLNGLGLFVDVGLPGTYELSRALGGPGPNDTTPLKCPHAAAVFGQIEAWDITYCYSEGKWQRVQTSD